MRRFIIFLGLLAVCFLTGCSPAQEAQAWVPVKAPVAWSQRKDWTEPSAPPVTSEPPEAVVILPPPTTEPDPWTESTCQQGEPIQPQPGDTRETWDPALAEEYPLDGDCNPMELLEKWMAVEGLTFADLEERHCEQLVLAAARATDGVETYTCCYEKTPAGEWAPVEGLQWMAGWMGKRGIAHDRRRDTYTSPAGLWALGTAFGNEAAPDGLKMPWRDVTPNTDWVCDADSIYYNTWQERDDPDLLDTWTDDVEHLEDYADAYAYACVIRYNTAPYIVPDRGCAIFLHCSVRPTEGCVGLLREDMLRTLLWLDPAAAPHILITGYQN